jgi:signal transduction histidine kinase
MKVDSATRSTRNIVRLVILAVALPSLLLTGMGVLAIQNEEAAAKGRLEKTYGPVKLTMAKRFNDEFDRLQAASTGALEDLVRMAGDDEEVDHAALDTFLEQFPYALNFFVLDVDGDPLVPGGQPLVARDHAELQKCSKQLGRLGDDLTAVGTELARKGPPLDPDRFVAKSRDLAQLLASPLLPHPAAESERLAAQLADRLASLERRDAGVARLNLAAIAARGALVHWAQQAQRPAKGHTVIGAHLIDDWRRLVVLRNVGGRLAGFEIVPAPFSELLTRYLREQGMTEDVAVEVVPLQSPKNAHLTFTANFDDKDENRLLSFVILKNSDLSWSLSLIATGSSPLGLLTHSRVPLYLWALVLIVGALAIGIGLTLRAVMREARISRLKTDFVSSVSHDLRTPLTSIRMFTETLLLGRVQSREEEKECLEIIAHEAERLSRLTERILDFARMEAGRKPYNLVPTRLTDVIDHALAATRPLVQEQGFEVAVEVAPDLPAVPADPDALVEALINLLTNAIKYSPEDKHITLTARRAGAGVAIAVADRGIGIAKGEHARIFETFYRVDCRRTTEVDGSGIGLSLVKHIVDAHGGKIDVDSSPGRGSVFTIHLPTSPSAVEEVEDGEHSRDRGRPVHREGPHPKPAL